MLVGDDATGTRPLTQPLASEFRVFGVGDYLFKEGEPRTFVYRVKKGGVAVFERRIGRSASIIEMAGQGDYVGVGCLEHYRDNARAVVESTVSFVPRAEFAQLAERDPKLRQKQVDAIRRDFEYGKVLANDRGRSTPVECVAAFLVAVSRQNVHEGRNPTIVSDSLKCGIVNSLLDLDINTLERALLELQGMGLVKQCPAVGLHLNDIEALERIADGDHQGMEAAFEGGAAGAVIGPRFCVA
jgi:CRP/FNR family transcriptional regulator